ncbi:MAG: hypothetical protein RRA15_01600 [bacterium]|nr:hypothetical protein [bacterium]MDT8365174.1 hypothetical protein [bacterium]
MEVVSTIASGARLMRSHPKKSVLSLTFTNGAKSNGQVIKGMKELAKGNEPYMLGAALVGVKGLQKIVADAASLFFNREFAAFDDMDEAKECLLSHG